MCICVLISLGSFSHGCTSISLKTIPDLALKGSVNIEANDLFEKYRGYLSIPFFSSLGEAYVKGNRSNDAVCGKSEKNV